MTRSPSTDPARIDVATQLFAAWSSTDLDAPRAHLAEDAVLYDVIGGEYRGWPAIREYFGHGRTRYPDLVLEPTGDFWVRPDGLALLWTMSATQVDDSAGAELVGRRWTVEGMSYLVFDGLTVVREQDYHDGGQRAGHLLAEPARTEGAVGLVEREPGAVRGLEQGDHRQPVDQGDRHAPAVGGQPSDRGRGRLDQPGPGDAADLLDEHRRRRPAEEIDLRDLLGRLHLVEQLDHDVEQLVRRRGRGQQSFDRRCPEVGEFLDHFLEQLLPRREVIIERGRSHAGPLDDVRNRHEVARLQREQLHRSHNEILAT
jgi:hypothetical protein